MNSEINTDDFWKELDQRVLDARIERKLFIEEITKLHKTIAAQAAVIEKYRLLIATFFHHYDCNIPHKGMMAEAIDELRMYEPPTDSTQILDEVRRAEREKCAVVAEGLVMKKHKYVNDGQPFVDHMHWEDIARAIRAME